MPAREAMDARVLGDEIAIPGLEKGRGPETGVSDAGEGLRAVVYHAEGAQSAEDAKLVPGGYCQADVRPEVLLEPGFEVWLYPLRVPVAGDEVDLYPLSELHTAKPSPNAPLISKVSSWWMTTLSLSIL